MTSVCLTEFVIILDIENRLILKVAKIRLQLFLLQESRKLSVCLEHLLRDTSYHEQAAEGNLWPILDKASTDAVVEKANVARGKELVRLCNVAGSTFRQGHSETALVSFALCREVDRPTNSKGGCILRRRKLASQRNEFFDTER